MLIKDFQPFVGVHCETTTTGSLVKQLGITLTEPMLFGLGQGLGFIFWNMKLMDFPFIGGRVKPLALTQSLADNLHLTLEIKETSSAKKAWSNVVECIDQGITVGLQLDSYYLEYFSIKFHFAGHFVVMYGYDETNAYLVDTKPNGGMAKTSLQSLAQARSEKGPMAAKNLMYTLQKSGRDYDIKRAIITAASNNAKEYLNPPIKNLGYQGIQKTSVEIKKWFKNSKDVEKEFCTTAMLMEQAGTGGALFRNLYRDFLQQAYSITKLEPFETAQKQFVDIAKHWTRVAELIDTAGKTHEERHITEAAEILVDLSEKEYAAMKLLEEIR